MAYALDFAAIAMSGIGNISECRIEKMINPAMSGLPAFLAPQGGLHSGFMIVQVAAASLVSENKILSHPASVDSIPTSADKEDHVSMGSIAGRKALKVCRNVEKVLAIELIYACQAYDFHLPLKSSDLLHKLFLEVRKKIPFLEDDPVFYHLQNEALSIIRNNDLIKIFEKQADFTTLKNKYSTIFSY